MHYVLVYSPLVGPATWLPVAEELRRSGQPASVPSLLGMAESPGWEHAVDAVASAVAESEESFVLVGHSGAGALLPVIGEHLPGRVAVYVFLDALLPPLSGEIGTDPSFLAHLRSLAAGDRLPPWSEWWGPDVMEALVPDPEVRASIEAELPKLPLGYFETPAPVPGGWDRVPVAYICLFAYASAGEEAEDRGYLVEHLPGGHLHLVVEPAKVAQRIVHAVEQLLREEPRQS